MDPSSFFPIISGMLGGAASAGLFKGPIQTVEDWWYINFGYTSSEKAEMLRAKQKSNIDAYKNSILEEASKIDPVNLKEPELKILGPALEASKYYIEEEELREMFAKLISSSMDKSKEKITHNSYVEIIKQLTPLDGDNLKFINQKNGYAPICNIKIALKKGGFKTFYYNVFLGNPVCRNQSLLGPSLDNLQRLGLLTLDYSASINPINVYDPFKKTREYLLIQKQNINQNNSVNLGILSSEIYSTLPDPELDTGILRLTSFGENFCATCL